MSFPQVQFVASPDAGAVVRFDFNTGTEGSDGQTKVLREGFSLGSPSLQGDPDGIGSEYGFRELSIPLRVNGTPATAATTLATLAREMGRQTNWLRFQASPTSVPYWFQTYRSAPVPLDWEQVRGTSPTDVSQWYVDLKLDADSFAYGARVTLPTVTITNDPAVPTAAISAPVVNTPTTATTGGTLAAATYFYVVTALTSAGESTISNRVSRVTTGSTSTVTVTWAAVTGATGYNVYRSTTSGSEKFLATVGPVTAYVDTGTATTAAGFPTVNTTAGNPMSYTLPVINGDVPSPLRLQLTEPAGGSISGSFALSSFGADTGSGLATQYVLQSSTFASSASDVGAETTASGWSGGSYRPITFATTAAHSARLAFAMSSSYPSASWKVYARVGRSDTSSTFTMQLTSNYGWTGETVAVPFTGTDTTAIVDLGVTPHPVNAPLSDSGLPPALGNRTIAAGRTAGAGQLRVDYLLLVPVMSPRLVGSTLGRVAYYAPGIVVNGENEDIYGLDYGAASVYSSTALDSTGSPFPNVYPGADNLLQLIYLQSVVVSAVTPALTFTVNVDMSYQPRWLWLAS